MNFEISLKKIRKTIIRATLKKKRNIVLIVFSGYLFFIFIICLIFGLLFDDREEILAALNALLIFLLIAICSFIRFYIILFKKIKGKGNKIITYHYEFNEENIMVTNLTNNISSILNKKIISNIFVLNDVIVVMESFCYIFPNNETFQKELGLIKE